jgi:hypothetical protein
LDCSVIEENEPLNDHVGISIEVLEFIKTVLFGQKK